MGMVIDKLVEGIKNVRELSEDDEAIFRYGAELLFNAAANWVGVFLMGAIFGYPLQALFFMAVYCFVKSDSGGYHAGSHLSCILQFNLFVGVLFLGYTALGMAPGVLYTALLAAVVMIFRFAPIEAVNKPLDASERHLHRLRARVKIVLISIVVLTCRGLQLQSSYLDFFYLAIVMIAVTIGRGVLEAERERKNGCSNH